MRGMMSKLKLTVNETKTRLCRLPERRRSTSWVTPWVGTTTADGRVLPGTASLAEEGQPDSVARSVS